MACRRGAPPSPRDIEIRSGNSKDWRARAQARSYYGSKSRFTNQLVNFVCDGSHRHFPVNLHVSSRTTPVIIRLLPCGLAEARKALSFPHRAGRGWHKTPPRCSVSEMTSRMRPMSEYQSFWKDQVR